MKQKRAIKKTYKELLNIAAMMGYAVQCTNGEPYEMDADFSPSLDDVKEVAGQIIYGLVPHETPSRNTLLAADILQFEIDKLELYLIYQAQRIAAHKADILFDDFLDVYNKKLPF